MKHDGVVGKKYSAFSFLGIPMTSKISKANYLTYYIDCKEKPSLLLFSQIHIFDARRLHSVIEKVGQEKFNDIKNNLIRVTF